MTESNAPTTLICDLGDVLFTWSPPEHSKVSRTDLGRLLQSPIWNDFERGKHTEDEAYRLLERHYSIPAVDIRTTLAEARTTLRADPVMFACLRRLHEKGIRMYVMSNISLPDWEFLRTRASEEDWALFEQTFLSALVGERKPDATFYQRVIRETRITPEKTVFLDDKAENVEAAKARGLLGIRFMNVSDAIAQLDRIFLY